MKLATQRKNLPIHYISPRLLNIAKGRYTRYHKNVSSMQKFYSNQERFIKRFIILIPARITFLTEKILRTTFPPKQIRSIFTESQNLTEKKSFWKSIRVNTLGLIKFETGLIPAFGRCVRNFLKAYPMPYPLNTLPSPASFSFISVFSNKRYNFYNK